MDFFTPERLEKIRKLFDHGKPFVFDDGDMRTLHFDERVVQSAMRISNPDELVILYTQAMTGFRRFQPEPGQIVLIGLGGGSIAKYCYRTLPSARVTVLENNADVIALRDRFMLPPDDARLRVLHANAVDFIGAQEDEATDVILLDGFDADGAPPSLYSPGFFAHCMRTLRAGGVLVANMADEPAAIVGMVKEAQTLFGIRHLWWVKTQIDNSHLLVAVKVDEPHTDRAERDAALTMALQRMCVDHELELVYPRPPSMPEEGA